MTIARAACIGGGVIGAGWIARLVLNGIDVAIFDPDPEAARKVEAVLENALQTPISSRRACRNVWT
jgi:carnitine 3-dehydrogenase